jgi:hypothetical protein
MGNNAVLLGGNWNEAANSGSRASNWNNSPTNSNTNIGARGVCDDVINKVSTALCHIYGAASRPVKTMWSAILSCYGEYTKRFSIAPSIPVIGKKARLAYYG